MYSNKENVNILTAHLVRRGVEHVVVCPGSRNAPLVHNFSECPSFVCHPVTDERSAAFVALGIAQSVSSPVVVCVTSGSALLNVLPGVAEATYQQRGVVVVSADRPSAWIGQLDGQTMPQPDALGGFVGRSVILPEPTDSEGRWHCNRLINEAFLALDSAPHASVHINVPISEPLFEFTAEKLPDVRLVTRMRWDDKQDVDTIMQCIRHSRRPMVVIGQMAEGALPSEYLDLLKSKVVVLAEPLSADMQRLNLVDQMLYRIDSDMKPYLPDLLIYIGGNTVSKRLRHFMRQMDDDAMVVMVNEDGTLHDVSQHAGIVLQGNPWKVISGISNKLAIGGYGARAFVTAWKALYDETLERHENFLPEYSQMLAVKLFEMGYDGETDIVYYANSTAVRLGSIYARHHCFCNRGLNGIEGSLSTAAGHALALSHNSEKKVYCVIGDLSFFYDENALWQQQLAGNLRILLLNNSQGGIFRHLKGLGQSPVRDTLISGSHTTNAEGVCKQFGVEYRKVEDAGSLVDGIRWLRTVESQRPVVLEVVTDVDADEEVFKAYYHHML